VDKILENGILKRLPGFVQNHAERSPKPEEKQLSEKSQKRKREKLIFTTLMLGGWCAIGRLKGHKGHVRHAVPRQTRETLFT